MTSPRLPSYLVLPALCIAVVAAGALALAGFGYRWGMWGFPAAFTIFRVVVFVGGAAGVLALAAS